MKKTLSILLVVSVLFCTVCAANAEYLTLNDTFTSDENGVYKDLGNYLIELNYEQADFEAAKVWLVGLPYGFLIGFALGVINLIPFFGTVVCLPIALPLAYFGAGGSMTRLVMVLVVWGVGQLLDGYFITPKIQGNKTGLGYAGVIFSFFFWAIVLGPLLGMLLAIPLSAFCVVLWRAVKAKYLGK